jgi:glycerol-3-phosphate acyltransferase PlsX
MRIGVDIMGGDFAPEATLLGAVLAHKELPDNTELVLFGDQDEIDKVATREGYDLSGVTVLHTPQSISMGENPATAISDKPESGIVMGLKMLKASKLDGFASVGNTGALLVGAIHIINSIPGVIRPCLALTIPNAAGIPTILLDVGLNPDARPDILYQYGIFGSIYAELVHGIKNPTVGLLNIGKEEEKGSLLTKAAYQAMKGTKDFNFVGNIEANDFFGENCVNVIVCDGFTGNVIVKEAESIHTVLRKRNVQDDFVEEFNYERFGGTPVLGILSPVLVGHGMSNGMAIRKMILHTWNVIESNLIEEMKERFQ